jgi:hypothetical protein
VWFPASCGPTEAAIDKSWKPGETIMRQKLGFCSALLASVALKSPGK